MRIPTIAALLISAVASAPAPAQTDTGPLAPAAKGMIQCTRPDKVRKTCASIAYYTPAAGGAFINRAIVGIAPQGPVTLDVTTTVTVKNGAVCGQLRPEDVKAGKLAVAGNALPAEQATPALEQIAQALAPMIGKELCTSFAVQGDELAATVTIDGAPSGTPPQAVIWVAQNEGYTVAP